jgi:hypothetical protein
LTRKISLGFIVLLLCLSSDEMHEGLFASFDGF